MSRKGRRRGAKYSNLVFFIPIAVVLVVVLFAFASGYINTTSTLHVQAVTSQRYSPSIHLHAPFTEGTVQGTTPYNITLAQGTYTIYFGAVKWYVTPAAKLVVLPGGANYFVTGIYAPVLTVFGLSGNQVNATYGTAEHGVTPVIWVNAGSSPTTLVLQGSPLTIQPGQNYTRVFQAAGTYDFSGPQGSFSGYVVVE